ncbi:MAG: LacI family DNA-binding transcriptional regulator, partial [Cruoricaptor ignavus]|nr:LacI family DNA-binding transcriptional regulator [Cruoricaptor ignavus]
PSIKDIAKLAGVSVATVSYVLNRKENHRIRKETQDKIFEIAKSINYQPNKVAKSLKTNETKLLGLLIADISNEFYSNITRSIENYALELGYNIIIGSSDENPRKFENILSLFSQQQVDGVIVAPVNGSEVILQKVSKEGLPLVTIDRYLSNVRIPGVMINNKDISEEVTLFLAKKDFDKIIYIGYDTTLPHLLDRQLGFESGIQKSEKNILVEKVLVGLDNIKEEIHSGLYNTLGTTPEKTALYFSSNKLAVAGLSFLAKHKIKVPDEVSVIAFDETEAYTLFPTEISYVKQPLEEMAEEAVMLLHEQIKKRSTVNKQITLMPKLVLRESII